MRIVVFKILQGSFIVLTFKNISVLKYLITLILFHLLTACGGGSSSSTPIVVPPPTAPAAPQNVQVVSGDGNDIEIQNTISWTLDSNVTDYVVYWSTAPGVTTSSSEVVPSAQGFNSITHSGTDVVEQSTHYYRVQAISSAGSSALSAEVAGTPLLSITNNQLNDVAWNGVDAVVAIGDSGVIIYSFNALDDPWSDTSKANTNQALTGITWENINSHFIIVGAGSTVLTGDGTKWDRMDLTNLAGAVNLEDVAWLGDQYIAVGKNSTILTSNLEGSVWTQIDSGVNVAATTFNAVARNVDRIVVVGTNGTILNSVDGTSWLELPAMTNNNLNDISWDGNQFTIVGSNDTILTSSDGITWTSHIPGTSDINFVAATQWDSSLPQNPVLATVGSAGTFVINPDAGPGTIIKTGTTEQLSGITWVDDGVNTAYFVIVGNDGMVLTNQRQ